MKSSFNEVISVVVLAPPPLVLLLTFPLHLRAAVGAGPPLRVCWEVVWVFPLPGDFLHRSHGVKFFLVRQLLLCLSSTASRTSAVRRLVELLLQVIVALLKLLNL